MSNFVQELYSSRAADTAEDPATTPNDSDGARMFETGTSIASSIMSIVGAGMRSSDMEKQAGDQLIAAEAEEAEGAQRVNLLLREQMRVSGELRAAFAASGVDLGSGSVKQMDRENRAAASDAVSKVRNRTSRRAAARRSAATALARRAAETFGGQVLASVISIGETLAGSGG